jgi:hypothetical protein
MSHNPYQLYIWEEDYRDLGEYLSRDQPSLLLPFTRRTAEYWVCKLIKNRCEHQGNGIYRVHHDEIWDLLFQQYVNIRRRDFILQFIKKVYRD